MDHYVVLTSSRDASVRVRQMLNELELAIPNAIKLNRGRSSLSDLAKVALDLGARYIVLFKTYHGNPSAMDIYRVDEGTLVKLPYIVTIRGVRLLRELVRVSGLEKPRDMIIVSMVDNVLGEVLSQVFGLQLFYGRLEDFRGSDSIMVLGKPQVGGTCCEWGFVDGLTYAPRGPLIRIRDVREVEAPSMVIRVRSSSL